MSMRSDALKLAYDVCFKSDGISKYQEMDKRLEAIKEVFDLASLHMKFIEEGRADIPSYEPDSCEDFA